MKARRRVVHAVEDGGGLLLVILLGFGRLVAQRLPNRLFLFPRLLRRRSRRRGAWARPPPPRLPACCPGRPLAAARRRPRRCRRSSVSTVPPAPLLWSSRRTRASTAPGPRLPRRGGGAAATTASLRHGMRGMPTDMVRACDSMDALVVGVYAFLGPRPCARRPCEGQGFCQWGCMHNTRVPVGCIKKALGTLKDAPVGAARVVATVDVRARVAV